MHIFQPLRGDEYIGSLLNSTWSTVHFMEFSAPPTHEPKVENKIYKILIYIQNHDHMLSTTMKVLQIHFNQIFN